MEKELIRDEGMILKPYIDSLGNMTIGVGHLIVNGEKVKAITRKEAIEILDKDISIAEHRLSNMIPSWKKLDDVRQRALLNLTFNLGYKLASFKLFMLAVKEEDWEKAADQLVKSKWYSQVKSRGPRIVHNIRTGTMWTGD
jgi:lysozyme